MNQSGRFDREYNGLMKTAAILRKHFSVIYGEIEAEMISLRRANKKDEYKKLLEIRKKMRNDHDESMDLIADKITNLRELRETRRGLRDAADNAVKFIGKMRKTKQTLDDFADAANFLSDVRNTLLKL